MQSYLLVFIGAGIGGSLRHAVNVGAGRLWGPSFPWSTFFVNVVGSFVMGALIAWLTSRAQQPFHDHARLFLATGVLGGFTTFSAFSLDAVALWERGELGLALAYVAASIVLSIAGLAAGLTLARSLAS